MFAFGMPQGVMGITENVNKANAIENEYTFARWIVKPELTRIKNKLNEQLIPKFPLAKSVEIDFDEVVPETIEEKRDLSESGVKTGWMTINEARKLNGFDPLPSGDMLLVPLNLIPTPIKGDIVRPEKPAPEIPPEEPKSKGLSDEHKADIWRNYILKTERQEQMFENVVNAQFQEQADKVIEELDRTGQFNESVLDDDRLAEKFKPAIEEIYGSAFSEAV